LVKLKRDSVSGTVSAIREIENIGEENLPFLKKSLKDKGCLTVDARVKERKQIRSRKSRGSITIS
jgi:ribosomal protein S9